jgi:glycosyltransferase involved in cell wall biosynthesis
MKCLSVVVPTAARPAYLRTALKSVANQTAADNILEVIVSENLSDKTSQGVCEEFPSLPIKYVFRNPPLHRSSMA